MGSVRCLWRAIPAFERRGTAQSALCGGGGPPDRHLEPIWAPPRFQCERGGAHSAILEGRGAAQCHGARGRPLSTSVRRGQAHSASLGGGGCQTASGT